MYRQFVTVILFAATYCMLSEEGADGFQIAVSIPPLTISKMRFKMSANNVRENDHTIPGRALARRDAIGKAFWVGNIAIQGWVLNGKPAAARLDPVNRPDLLPKERGLNVIQIEKFLTSGQAKRLDELLVKLEKDTGFRVRVLCQSYPNTRKCILMCWRGPC